LRSRDDDTAEFEILLDHGPQLFGGRECRLVVGSIEDGKQPLHAGMLIEVALLQRSTERVRIDEREKVSGARIEHLRESELLTYGGGHDIPQ